jgi:hypothetical protein
MGRIEGAVNDADPDVRPRLGLIGLPADCAQDLLRIGDLAAAGSRVARQMIPIIEAMIAAGNLTRRARSAALAGTRSGGEATISERLSASSRSRLSTLKPLPII